MPLPNSYKSSPPQGLELTQFDGLLLVDKPVDFTSHDVVNIVRGRLRIKKTGHGGTLDPSATGLLVLLLGRATRLSDRIMGGDKLYEGTLRLGASTNTQDADGEITATGDASGITEETLKSVLSGFKGDQYQIPPMVSAIKRDGVPLYKLARKGEVVEREPRFIHVYDISLLEFGIPDSRIRVRCSKGTYVRTLCHDIGEKLGCHGHLTGLRRLRCGNFDVADAVTVEQIKTLPPEEIASHVLPFLSALERA